MTEHKYNLIGTEDTDSEVDIFNARAEPRTTRKPRRREIFHSVAPKVMIGCFCLGLVAGLVAIGVVHFKTRTTPKVTGPQMTVQTTCGLVSGTADFVNRKNQYAYTFRGIPYAEAPVSDLRWRPPVPLNGTSCWKGTFPAHTFGPPCAQGGGVGQEDCLYLNVWTPSLTKNGGLPVMVWIHGGYLLTGNGNDPGYSPDGEFVTSMNVVAVSMNYRLNAFGFLTLKELWRPKETYGNYGIMDQIAVLKWVRNNIHNFGGNPNSVTVVGQSSGGSSIFALLASPLADGLFHRAISMSGSPYMETPYKKAAFDNKVFLVNSKCDKAKNIRKCLLALKADKVLDSIPWKAYPRWGMDGFMDFPEKGRRYGALLVIDPLVITNSITALKNVSRSTKVKVLIGNTGQEVGIQPIRLFKNTQNVSAEMRAFVKGRLDAFGENFTDTIFNLYANLTDSAGHVIVNRSTNWWFDTLTTDVCMTCPLTQVAGDFNLNAKIDAYRYVTSEAPRNLTLVHGDDATKVRNSFHVWDAFALFNYKMVRSLPYNLTAADLRFLKSVRRIFADFIREGKLPEGLNTKNTADFSRDGTVVVVKKAYHEKQCQFWNNQIFHNYTWIN